MLLYLSHVDVKIWFCLFYVNVKISLLLILCSLIARELRFSRAMIFAINEINNSTKLLPGIKLGYQIYDSCASVPVAVHVAFQLSNGQDPEFYKNRNCSQSGVVMAAVGDSASTPSISVSSIMGSFNIPLVSSLKLLQKSKKKKL